MRRARALAPLRHRQFRLLVAGQLASNVGDTFYAVALPWYVLAAHGGALLLGTVLAVYGVARTVVLAFGGHASDRFRPWTVMMVSDLVRVVAVTALVVVATMSRPSLALLAPIALVLGAGEGLFLPGSFSIIPALLHGDDLQAGNALSSGSTQLAVLVGPALGGAVVALLGAAPAFAVDAVSFAVSAVTLLGIRARDRALAASSAADEADEADAEPQTTLWQLIRTERVLPLIFVVDIAANLGSGGMGEVALPALAHGPFHAGATGYGALVAAFGGGALVGTLVAAQAKQARRPGLVGSFAFATEAIFMAFVPYLGGTISAAVMLACFGALNGFGNVLTLTALQRWGPPALLGRIMGFVMLGSFGIFPVSVLLGGIVVHGFGPAIFFPLAAGALLIAIAGALTQREWREFGTEGSRAALVRA